MDGEQLWALIEGLETNHLVQYTHLLTGEMKLSRGSPPAGWSAGGTECSAIWVPMGPAKCPHFPCLCGLRWVHYAAADVQTHHSSSVRICDMAPVTPLPPFAGYIGSISLLHTIVRVAEKLRQYNPALTFGVWGGEGGGGQLFWARPLGPTHFFRPACLARLRNQGSPFAWLRCVALR